MGERGLFAQDIFGGLGQDGSGKATVGASKGGTVDSSALAPADLTAVDTSMMSTSGGSTDWVPYVVVGGIGIAALATVWMMTRQRPVAANRGRRRRRRHRRAA